MAQLPFPEVEQGPLRVLLRELHLLHAQAGWPSTRTLAVGQDFSHVAVHDLMTKATGTPRLPVLLAVVAQLAEVAPRVDVEETLDDFDKMWRSCVGDVARSMPKTTRAAEVSEGSLDARGVQYVLESLTSREHLILYSLDMGLSVEQIARKMYISHSTARYSIRSIGLKLGVTSIAELLRLYRQYSAKGS